MDMMSAIAGGATAMSQSQLMQQVSLSLTKKSMDTTEVIAQGLLEMLPQQPGVGEHVNILA